MKATTLITALAAAVLLGGSVQAADIAGARAFVTALYGHYPTAGRKGGFDALDAKQIPRLFHPSLIALIKEDERLAGDEVPALDGDPVCDCQDDGDMAFTIRRVGATGPTRAVAEVLRRSADNQPLETLTLDLLFSDGRWRIWDIHSKDTPSLRGFLVKNNQERRKTP
ncbi:MAG TPA: hypothetical protein VG166_12675 [Caulobacteraceae bacterium]|jgi:hypothetical protein|nr:hypothetical protein [Caulobacteraceae bacterium]